MVQVHFECEKSLTVILDDGKQSLLSEGTQAYMHFVTAKINTWMLATVLELKPHSLVVKSADGLEWTFYYKHLDAVSDKMPEEMEGQRMAHLIANLTAVPHARLPKEFAQAVSLLTRPYYPLTPQQLTKIEALAAANDSNILEDESGNQYTWGGTDNCMQLMPLKKRLDAKRKEP